MDARVLYPRPLVCKSASPPSTCSWILFYGSKRLGFAVIPDDCWPLMWRVLWPDGQLSDMANLSRCHYAAQLAAERSASLYRDATRFRWKMDVEINGRRGSLVRPIGGGAPGQGGAP
jgi:hypothetical protein